jgi:hypothetical protein
MISCSKEEPPGKDSKRWKQCLRPAWQRGVWEAWRKMGRRLQRSKSSDRRHAKRVGVGREKGRGEDFKTSQAPQNCVVGGKAMASRAGKPGWSLDELA